MAAALGIGWSQAATAACELKQIGDLPVASDRGDIIIDAKVNGRPTQLVLDTGSAVTAMWRDRALALGVKLGNAPGAELYGVGGRAPIQLAYLDSLAFGGASVRNFRVYVFDSRRDGDISMLLGEEFFIQSDVEFDLEHHSVRMLKESGCTGPELIYWNKPYSQVSYVGGDTGTPPIYLTVMLNGQPVEAELDSGSSATVVDDKAAARIGAVPDRSAPAVGMNGVGFKELPTTTVMFKTFTIGDETIQNAKIQAAPLFSAVHVDTAGTHLGADLSGDMPRMLLGADFLRAHRLLISRPHQMMYFTYVGGPVFDVAHRASVRPSSPQAAPAPATAPPR